MTGDPGINEPSVLDYVKARLMPWKGPAPEILMTPGEDVQDGSGNVRMSEAVSAALRLPWSSLTALIVALFAQMALEPEAGRLWNVGLLLYTLAAGLLVWSFFHQEWSIPRYRSQEQTADPLTVRSLEFGVGVILALFAFVSFQGNRFNIFNLTLWCFAIVSFVRAFWVEHAERESFWRRALVVVKRRQWDILVSRWTVLVLFAAGVVIFFRVYRLADVPPQMVSDHAEKLLDVWDVLHGETWIFFPRNTGREAIQMYLTAGVVRLFGTGYSFLSLKIGTAIAGLLTLPFIYLLGVEVGNRRVGLFAAVLAGVAYWPNVITRVALRFTLYPLFVAPTLYFLIRGIRRSNRNDFILAGLSLGLGLHGYTPFRIMPFVVVAAVGIYLISKQSAGVRNQTIYALMILALISLIVFLPLGSYATGHWEMFGFRAFSRVGSVERPLPEPAWQIFVENLGNALKMYTWDDGEIWPVSVPHRPALDVVSAALFVLGVAGLLARYIRQRHWLDLFLLLSIPLLMMPSILSLAFPNENPAPNRASGAMVPVFLITALALEGLFSALRSRLPASIGKAAAWIFAVGLIFWSANHNYDLVFRQYQQSYANTAWNTTEMGQVIKNFSESIGSLDTAWVVAYPHWVDTRLVGMNAGNPTRDYAIWTENLGDTIGIAGPKLFLLNYQDGEALRELQKLYPEGWVQEYDSRYENKDFLLYLVPRQNNGS